MTDSALSFPVSPMKATLGSMPAADDQRWAYEIKWDGYRTLAFIDDDRLQLQSSGGIDVTERYPEIAALPQHLNATSAIVDGELVVLDADGKPRFEWLQRHEHAAAFYIFDVLCIDGTETIGLSYLDRRRLLEQLIEPGDHHLVPTHRLGDGSGLFAASQALGLEGVMAKRADSLYQPGARTPNWLKIKHRRQIDVVVGGFTRGTGARQSTFGALLVGFLHNDGRVQFAGGIGSGFSDATLVDLHRRLTDLEITSSLFSQPLPARYEHTARWAKPVLWVTIEMTELTNDGLIRHGSFIKTTEPTTD